MRSLKLNMFLLLAVVLGFASCEEDSDSNPNPSDGAITMALKTSGEGETEFIVSKNDIMSGEISAVGTGIEQTGWRFYYQVGKTLFASGYSDDNQCLGYARNADGLIAKKGEFVFDNALEMFGASEDKQTLLAIETTRTGYASRRLHLIDVNTVKVQEIKDIQIWYSQNAGLIAWPTAVQVRDDKMFIPFHKLDVEGKYTTPSVDTAFVAVYSYPNIGGQPEKIITDTRTGHLGVNGSTTTMIQSSTGDFYAYSCGTKMAGFAPVSSKPSGILRIKKGETEFDQDYFFNIDEATNGGKLFWLDYIGGNKAIGRILINDSGEAWGAFGRDTFNQKAVIIDLETKTVTDIEGIPMHAKRFTAPIVVENNEVYLSIETATDAYVYKVDVENATATKGAKIVGKTIKGFFKL